MLAILAQADKQAPDAPSDQTAEFIWLLVFGFAIIVLAALVSIRREGSTVTFMRMAGLLSIATIAGALVLLDVSGEALTAAFTVLGTIAGYLAGAKTPAKSAGADGAPAIAESGI
jgi:peptidoglycan/LPS O-acetylase OafA/YrhL